MRLAVFFLGLIVFVHAGEPLKFSSGENRTHLLELYSSEGCSSCPPAEQWLGGLRDAPGLWRDFVPVSFHVVYWDRLGWPDRFATKAYTERQYAYSSQWRSDTVYTPEFVLDGAEWRKPSGSDPTRRSDAAAGVLSISYTGDGVCRITFDQTGKFETHVALLGGGIISKVGAGENDGRTLQHDFVVLELKSMALDGGFAELKLAQPVVTGVSRRAIAVWITRRGELAPLQATGGWLE